MIDYFSNIINFLMKEIKKITFLTAYELFFELLVVLFLTVFFLFFSFSLSYIFSPLIKIIFF